ncbi:unnamed protein product [Lepidochelys olivacea]
MRWEAGSPAQWSGLGVTRQGRAEFPASPAHSPVRCESSLSCFPHAASCSASSSPPLPAGESLSGAGLGEEKEAERGTSSALQPSPGARRTEPKRGIRPRKAQPPPLPSDASSQLAACLHRGSRGVAPGTQPLPPGEEPGLGCCTQTSRRSLRVPHRCSVCARPRRSESGSGR